MPSSAKPTVTVIIPVHNGGQRFGKCLRNLVAAEPAPDEIIIVADGESDGSWRMARELGMHVLKMPTARGPAQARNLGARSAKGDILFFIDADVTIPADTVHQICAIFQDAPNLAAVFGSYDDAPAETNFLSQYKNLLHHYVHQTSNEEAATFWSGCGAIRRDVFLKMGGFDKKYRWPSIEDIELGYRLKKAGYKNRLIKTLKVKHLKHWDIFSLIKADFFYRALPWTRLILRDDLFLDDLNLKISHRVSVVCIYLLLFSLLAALFIPKLVLAASILLPLLVLLNLDLYGFFKNKRGLGFAVKTIPWHWFYFFYSGLAFSIGYCVHKINWIADSGLKGDLSRE
jgi:GT2 family glycosyltransferase